MKRITAIPLALTLAMVMAAPAFSADQRKSDSYLAEGRKTLQKGDVKAAIIQLKNAVQANPDNAAARYELGIAELRANDLASAEKEFRAAKDRHYSEDELAVAFAELYVRQRKFEQLLTEIAPGERAAETESSVRLARGLAYLSLQRLDDAEKSIKEAIERTAKPSRAQIALGRVRAAAKDFEGSLAAMQAAIDADPKNAEAWLGKGQVLLAKGDRAAAREAIDKALELQPSNNGARLARAQLLIQTNELQLAQSDINEVLKANGNDPLGHYLNALLLARQQNYRAAETALQKMGGFVSNYPPALFLQATINQAQDQLAQAEDSINRYLALVPGEPTGTVFLAGVLTRRGNVQRAIEVLKAASVKHPDDARLLAALSDAYIRNRQPEDAAAVLDRVAKLSAENPQMLTAVATQRLRIGKSAEAMQDLEAATELAPDSTSAGMLLVLTHLQNNQIDEAEKAALALSERQKDNPVVENLLGVISLRKSGPDAAVKHFRRALEMKPDFTPAEMNIAQLEVAARHFDKAQEIYGNILKRDATNEQALLALATLSFNENKADEGVLWLEKARNGNPRAVASRLRLVEIYVNRKDAAKAIAVGRELTEIAPTDPRSHNALGQAHLAAGEYESAIGEFRRYLDLQPNTADPKFQMARVYMAQKDTANARTWLERALEANLGDLDMQQRYTEFALASQALDPAIAYARTLVKQRPKEAPADLLLAGLLEVANKPNEALTVYQQAAAKLDHPVVVNRLSAAYARAGEPVKAAETLENWLTKNPNDDRTRFALASLFIAQKKYDAATKEHERLLAGREANSPVILNNLAWLYSLEKDPRALEYAEKAYGMAQTPNIADTYGWILLEKGDTARALPILEKAAAEAPAAGQIRYHYAVALKKSGRTADARRELETVVKGNQPLDELDAAKSLLKEVGG